MLKLYSPSWPWRNSVPPKRSALAPATFIDACLPTRAECAPSADGWVHEIRQRLTSPLQLNWIAITALVHVG